MKNLIALILLCSLQAFAGISITGGSSGGGAWGSITGTLSNQTDLNTALSGKQSTTLANGKILVGNGSNVATAVTPSGDVTIDNTGVLTIGSTKVTNAMLAGSIAASKLVGTDIATVGTITSGTWSGTAIGVTKGGTGLTSIATGSILYGSAANTISELTYGTSGYFLKTQGVGQPPVWAQVTPSYPLYADDGYNANTPSFSRSGDTNTGIGFPTADAVSGIAGGSEVSRSTYLAGTYNQLILNPGGPSNGKTAIFYIRPSGTWTTGGAAYISFTDDVTEYVQGPNPRGLSGENGQFIFDHNGTVFALWDKNKNYRLMLRAGGNAAGTNTASSGIAAGGTKKTDITPVGNVGGGTDDLISYTIPASVLGTNGDKIEWTAFGTFGATTTADITCNYGGTTLFSASSLSAANNDSWEAHGTITRTGATAQVATSSFEASLGGTVTKKQAYTAPAETLSGTVVLKCTGTSSNATDNDIVQKALTVNWFPYN